MSSVTKTGSLLFRLRSSDSISGISRRTLTRLAKYFGFTETQVMHYALRMLAKEVLPAYEMDDGELTPTQIGALRKILPQGHNKSIRSSLFE